MSRCRPEKVVAFVVARLTSSRLEAKQFRTVGNRALLEWTLFHLSQSREIDQIVLTTASEPANRPLRDFAEEQGIECFWYEGDPNHVTHRLRSAADAYEAEICLLISGDCPLVDGAAIDHMVKAIRQNPEAQVVEVPPLSEGFVPLVEGMGVFRRRAWQEGDDLADRPELKENHFPTVWQNPGRFPVLRVQLPARYYGPHHRMSVDTPADMEFMDCLFRTLSDQKKPFDLPEVIELMKEQPELCEINRHVYQRRLGEEHPHALFVVDSGPEFGYGHLMRSRELGRRMVEELSWPVTFVVDDLEGARRLLSQGCRVVWGALGREVKDRPEALKDLPAVEWQQDDLVILDLYPRELPEDWRSGLLPEKPVVVLDCLAGWAQTADLVVIPGVTYEEDALRSKPEHLAGVNYTLLRKDVLQQPRVEKDLDVLAYLPCPEKAESLKELAKTQGWSLVVVDGHSDSFVQDMARARVFVGNFGISFYEAVRLCTLPVTWPLSPRHQAEAEIFYNRLGFPPMFVNRADELLAWVEADSPHHWHEIPDGTAEILLALKKRFSESRNP